MEPVSNKKQVTIENVRDSDEGVRGRLEVLVEELRLLQRINNAVNLGTPLKDVLKLTTDGVSEIFDYAACDIYLLEKDATHLVLASLSINSRMLRAAEQLTGLKAQNMRIELFEGSIFGEVVRDRRVIVSDDMARVFEDFTTSKSLKLLAAAVARIFGFKSVIRAPLVAGDRVIGLIGLARDSTITGADADVISRFASQVALAINKAQTEEEKDVLQEQLIQSQKLEAVGQLAGGIAHDFNNILAGIVTSCEVIRMQIGSSSPAAESVETIEALSSRAKDLIMNLLAFSRKQDTVLRPVDLNAVVRDVHRILLRLVGADVEMKTSLNGPALTVMADPVQVEQVLMNLATNAVDAMPGGGRLFMGTSRDELKSRPLGAHGEFSPGHYALLTVRDNGDGMDPVTMKQIFNPFFTTKKAGSGTGLGLSLVHGIVQKHGGMVEVQSRPGHGAQFVIYLPLVGFRAEKAETAAPARSERGTETVLLAEDAPRAGGSVRSLMEAYGYTVIAVTDGNDALAKFHEYADDVDLLVLDLVMPGRNGLKVYEEISRDRPDIKVLFTSGYTAEALSSKGAYRNGLDFLAKPAMPHELLRALREALDK